MAFNSKVAVKEITVSAIVIRADGTREDLGVICRSKPLGLMERIKLALKKRGNK